MLSGAQIYAANQWAAISALAHDNDLTDWLHEAYSELKSEKAADETSQAIKDSTFEVRDFFEYNDSAREEFYEYIDEAGREIEAYDEDVSLLDNLEAQLRQRLGKPSNQLWPASFDGQPSTPR